MHLHCNAEFWARLVCCHWHYRWLSLTQYLTVALAIIFIPLYWRGATKEGRHTVWACVCMFVQCIRLGIISTSKLWLIEFIKLKYWNGVSSFGTLFLFHISMMKQKLSEEKKTGEWNEKPTEFMALWLHLNAHINTMLFISISSRSAICASVFMEFQLLFLVARLNQFQ